MSGETFHWHVYDLPTHRVLGAFDCEKPLGDLAIYDVLRTVFSHIPSLRGGQFCVSDEDEEKIYMRWSLEDCYDEYTLTGFTSFDDIDNIENKEN